MEFKVVMRLLNSICGELSCAGLAEAVSGALKSSPLSFNICAEGKFPP